VTRPPLPFTVLVDDNFHYMDESYRTTLGSFATLDEAIAASKARVEEYLETALESGGTAESLYRSYMQFGPDPFVVSKQVQDIEFSAWNYAKERSKAMCPPPERED
jgi:hypothetical protein